MIYCSFCCIYVWLDPGTYMIARFMSFYKPGVTIYTAAAIRLLGFCLDYSVENSFAAVSVCETPTLRLIIHLQSHFNWAAFFRVLACVFFALAGISLFGEVNRVVTRLITRGVVVLRLLDLGLRIWSRIGVSRSAYNESYPESDGRSGTHILIKRLFVL